MVVSHVIIYLFSYFFSYVHNNVLIFNLQIVQLKKIAYFQSSYLCVYVFMLVYNLLLLLRVIWWVKLWRKICWKKHTRQIYVYTYIYINYTKWAENAQATKIFSVFVTPWGSLHEINVILFSNYLTYNIWKLICYY